MKLGKLLGAGKSFVSGGKPAAYRTDKRVYLPQFVSPKNPFVNPGPAEAPAPAELPKPAKLAGPARTTTWVSKLNPVSIFRAAPPSVDKNVTPVQAELSLEKIKVVHNDLTDAEVEIVPMKSRPAREAAAGARPVKKTWETLGERIMKVTAL